MISSRLIRGIVAKKALKSLLEQKKIDRGEYGPSRSEIRS
jgi:hypothetical protein